MALKKTVEEINILREGGIILASVLKKVAENVKPGISTKELDQIAQEQIKEAGAMPAFLGYKISDSIAPYPSALCTSVDDEVVHGIPRKDKILKEGQIIGLDLGIKYKNLFTDSAITVPVGRISPEKQKLIDGARRALYAGIRQVKPGNTIGDIACAIQEIGERQGFGIIRDLVGHGVGHSIHEPPNVPNYGKAGTLEKLEIGMVLALEPMFTTGDYHIRFLDDNWTVATADGSISAHFEHSIAITDKGCIILTE